MTRSLRCAVAVGVLLVGAAGISYATPEWTEDLGVDFWNLSRMNQQVEQCRRQCADLDSQSALVRQRIACKCGIAEDLLAGRISLGAAAMRYRNLNANAPYFEPTLQFRYPDSAADELQCHNVIDYLRNQFPNRPDAQLCAARCEIELELLRSAGAGKVRLPD